MKPRPVLWALWSLVIHAIPPGFVLLLLESKRPGEGLSQAWRFWPLTAMVVYGVAAAFMAFCVARRWAARSPEWSVGALIGMDAFCFVLTWSLGRLYPSGVAIVLALPLIAGAALLVRRRIV